MMKKATALLALTLALGSAVPARADTEAQIIRIATYADKEHWYVVLDRHVACGGSSAETSNSFQFKPSGRGTDAEVSFDRIFALATAALLSGKPIEVAGNGSAGDGFCRGVWLALKKS